MDDSTPEVEEEEIHFTIRSLAGREIHSGKAAANTALSKVLSEVLDALQKGEASPANYKFVNGGEIAPMENLLAAYGDAHAPVVLELITTSDSASALNGSAFCFAGYEHEGDNIYDGSQNVSSYSWRLNAHAIEDGSIQGCILWLKHSSRFGNERGLGVWEPEFVIGTYDDQTRKLTLGGQVKGLGSGLAVGSYQFTVDETGKEIELKKNASHQIFMVGHVMDERAPDPFPSPYAWAAMELAIRLGFVERARVEACSHVAGLAELFSSLPESFSSNARNMKFDD